MDPRRRAALAAGGLAALSMPIAAATAAGQRSDKQALATAGWVNVTAFGVRPDLARDQTRAIQRALDACAGANAVLTFPAGRYLSQTLTLRDGSVLMGAGPSTRLISQTNGPLIQASQVSRVAISNLTLDGARRSLRGTQPGVLQLATVRDIDVSDLHVTATGGHGISLARCGGRVYNSHIENVGQAGLFTIDSSALLIDSCEVLRCGNNGIQVWQSRPRDDGSIITNNRISEIRADGGGTGQNGNGINIYRADGVTAEGNRIVDCAYSAIRANSSSNVSMIANQVRRLGEVALYVEFAFQGAVVSQNTVEDAATGISVTNFNDGGRLAVVQGNLVRNMKRREFEPVDKRGNGIAVEADTAISGNVVEGAPTAGIWIGTRSFMRNVSATGNIVRDAGIGIAVSGDPNAGVALIANNILDRVRNGAIRQVNGSVAYGRDLVRGASTATTRISATGNVLT